MIAAEDERELVFGQGALHHLRQSHAGFGDLWKIFGLRLSFWLALRLHYRHVAEIFYYITQFGQAAVQISHADCRWPHVDAAASGAEIERRTDDRDVGMSHVGLGAKIASRRLAARVGQVSDLPKC